MAWDLVIIVLALYNCLMIPINVSFGESFFGETNAFDIVDYVVDSIFVIDIAISFRTSFLHQEKKTEITEPRLIARNYVCGSFWIDLLATIPFDRIFETLISTGKQNL